MTEWDAEKYARSSSLQEAMANLVLAKLQLHGTERVLDIGCGDGKITAQIAKRLPVGSVLGVDPSKAMIEYASQYFCPDHANLSFAVADARQLKFNAEFDQILSFNALHWIPDQDRALRSIYAALKPEGHAWLRMVTAGERKSLEDVLDETRLSPRWQRYFQDFQHPYLRLTVQQYRDLAQASGFRVLDQTSEDHTWDFKTREAFVAFATATFVVWTRQLPESEHPAFIKDVLDRYQSIAANNEHEANTFKFYQMNIELAVT